MTKNITVVIGGARIYPLKSRSNVGQEQQQQQQWQERKEIHNERGKGRKKMKITKFFSENAHWLFLVR